MSEYWVSKKQYWCKYCSLFIRDDAPSKRLHESGLKHQGNKERFIRDLYKGGERAKRDKEIEAQEYARIEAAAKSAYAKDKGMSAPAAAPRRVAIASSSRTRPPPSSGDKFANYSSAAQLGFDDEETQLTSYEIEQMVRGRGTNVGAWEEVVAPRVTYGADGLPEKRKAEEEAVDEDDPEQFKFSHRDKRPTVWDDDDWDPKAALSGLKLKSKPGEAAVSAEAAALPPPPAPAADPVPPGAGLDRSAWSGKLELGPGSSGAAAAAEGEVKAEESKLAEEGKPDAVPEAQAKDEGTPPESKPAVPDTKPEAEAVAEPPAAAVAAEPEPAPAPAASMFKKRRPPPSSRKK
ncbi:hypothetical protein Q8F55_000838 [Vanrija albida]|uniref:Matrin-type domain-containing protein n=1 Tax=Vanrija albida TaxID=181172 RepID=A0ABR3QEE3_9TREE